MAAVEALMRSGAQARRCGSQSAHVRRDPERETPAGEGWRHGDQISGDTSTLLLMRPDSRKL